MKSSRRRNSILDWPIAATLAIAVISGLAGIDLTAGGLTIRSHSPLRVLAVTTVLLVIRWRLGIESPPSWLARIALLTAIYKTGRHGTMAEVLIALEVIDSNLEGKPHSMKSLSSKLGIPYTSVSRIVYSLTAEAQPGGVLKLVPDSKDRRRKHIELDTDALKRMSSHVRALEKAMIDYYGASVYKLKKDQPN